jgi:protein-S-isoprenylcysteine O-methyltransferase Ste14
MTVGIAALLYGIASYLVFLGAFLYAIGFVENLLVPKSIDSGPEGPLGRALLVNALLLGLFAIPHSVMARPGFKRWWTRIVPAAVERSTYVLVSSLLLFLLYWGWEPMTGAVWTVEHPVGRIALQLVCAAGWALALWSTCVIDHFELFGLRQVYARLRGTQPTPRAFMEPGPYRYVRHPLMVGFLVAFWATPDMSLGHLLFSIATTGYIVAATVLEERDLVAALGEPYRDYQKRVPMLLPRPPKRS